MLEKDKGKKHRTVIAWDGGGHLTEKEHEGTFSVDRNVLYLHYIRISICQNYTIKKYAFQYMQNLP